MITRLFKLTISIFLMFLPVFSSPLSATEEDSAGVPVTHAMMTFFYYDNHAEAVAFYKDKLGFKEILNDGWIVIFEAAPGSRIALADSVKGSLKPVKDKGALIAIETEELESWFDVLKARGVQFISGWEEGDYVQQFRIYDPGGYIVEFVRWHPDMKKKFRQL